MSEPAPGQRTPARGTALRRAIAWTSGGQVVLFMTQMVSQVALARLLTPREMGVFAAALATTSLVAAVQGIGLNQLVIREPSDRLGLLQTAFTVNAVLSLLLAGAIYALGYAGAAVYHDDNVRRVMAILALPPILGLFQFLPAAILQRDMHFHWIALINTARVVVTAATTIALAVWGFGAMSLGWGSVAGAIVGATLFCAIGRHHLMFRPRLREWRTVTSFGLQMMAISGVTVLSGRVADLVLGRILGLGALGIFSRASGINALLWENIHAVLGRIFLSDLAERYRNGQSLRQAYLKILDVLTAMLWPAFAGLAILARPLVLTVYGANWTAAADPLSLLCVGSIILISVSMTWEVFVICGETGRQAKIETQRNLIGLSVFCLGCLVSIVGAAGARILDALISVTLYRRPLQRMTQTTWCDVMPIYRRSALLTGAAVAPSALLMGTYRFSYATPLVLVGAGAGLGVLLWLTTLWLMKHPLFQELRFVRAKLSSSRVQPA